MADRRLVVTEADSTDPNYGEMFALAPNNATGVAIPSFRVGTSRPTVGTTNGEGFYDTTSRQGYVWDGAAWRDIAANPIVQFATDALLLADTTASTGSYAISTATGNLYVRRPTGWARVGIAGYPTVADLLGDAPLQGTLGEALDEGSLWTRTATSWRCLTVREFADTSQVLSWNWTAEVHTLTIGTPATAVGTETVAATINGTVVSITATAGNTPSQVAAVFMNRCRALVSGLTFAIPAGDNVIRLTGLRNGTPVTVTATTNITDATTVAGAGAGVNNGDRALALDSDVTYIRTGTGWRPDDIWEDTEANIRAATWPLNGQSAIATDTGRTFARIGGAWVEEPIAHYATEAVLLAATPPNGTLAWADDTQVAFTRAGGTWHRLQGPQISIGATAPATPGAGDMYVNSTTNVLEISDGTNWHVPQSAGGVIGDVRQSLLTEAQFATALGAESANWVLCDGRSVAGTAYATVTGRNNVPDLRGAFLRMAGTNASNGNWIGGALNGYQEDSTARPKNGFIGTTNTTGAHTHSNAPGQEIRSDGSPTWRSGYDNGGNTGSAGDHQHTVSITGGGDAETRPKSYSVNYFIKVR